MESRPTCRRHFEARWNAANARATGSREYTGRAMAALPRLAVLLAVLTGVAIAQGGPHAAASMVWLMGDADCNKEVDSRDANLVLQFDAGLTPPLRCKQNAHADGDVRVTSTDAQLILQFEASLIDHLPPIRTFVGTVTLGVGVEGECISLQTDDELFVLGNPEGLNVGQRVRVRGFIDPWTFHLFCAARFLSNMSVEPLD